MTKIKLKPGMLVFSLFSLFTFTYAQNISPQSINSGGNKLIQSNGTLSFTLGELAVLSQSDSQGNTIGSGFYVGATLSTLNIHEIDKSVIDVNVYPNPTTDLINIQIIHSSLDQVLVSISDLHGKEIYSGRYAGVSNLIGINTSTYASGAYFLTLKSLYDQILGTYRIIKY
jgi:hypothetical protein